MRRSTLVLFLALAACSHSSSQTTGAGGGGHGTGGAHAASTSMSATTSTSASASASASSTGGAGLGGAGGSPGLGGAGGHTGSGGAGGGPACPPGETACAGVCVETANDVSNCGACGNTCTVPHAKAWCKKGMCMVELCDTGWTDCNGQGADGCEANVESDPMNCGTCGTACGGSCPCVQGMCNLTCPAGYTTCPGDPACGCTTMLGTNQNCNFCGDTCGALPNATTQCVPNPQGASANTCAIGSCNDGWGDCDGIVANGCEADLSESTHCGVCGNMCTADQTCVDGACQ